jgi:acyl-CoA synthetase (AMP-forming)/AMP-acid ligase II
VLIWDGGRLTYGQLHARVRRCAAALERAGVRAGDRVAMLSPPCWEQIVAFLACAHVRAIFVGLNPRHSTREHDYVLADSRARLLLARGDLLGALGGRPAVVVDDDFEAFLADGDAGPPRARPTDPVGVVYTSGSTGARKGALLTHRGLLAVHRGMLARMPLSHPVNCLNDLPTDHLSGLVERLVPTLLTGGHTVLRERFDPVAFLRQAVKHNVNFMQGEVTQWLRCVGLPEFRELDFSGVEVALFVGAAPPPGLVAALCGRFRTVMTGWGMSETHGGVTLTDPLGPDAPPAVVGRVLPGMELRISDEGEIVARGPMVMPGYLGRPAHESGIDADGWLHTGDDGVLEPDGSLRIIGRRSDMYKSGGYNVYPREIEAVLEEHPDIAHAAVVAVPDADYQAVGVAFVVSPAAPAPALLAEHCRRSLAGYKIPKQIRVVDALPLLANGKVDKPALRAMAEWAPIRPG